MAATIFPNSGSQGARPVGDFIVQATTRTLLFGLAVGAAMPGPATAAERLTMPFACRVVGGQVQVAPSAPQTYQIYGHREQKRLTTCSPYNPQKCHDWSVHRFDLDCGGVRTSWQSVVTALSPILAESLGPFDDAGYPPPGRALPYRRGPGPRVDFPRGFAPNPMKVAKFEQTAPVMADIPMPPKKPESTEAELTEPELTEAPQVAEIVPDPEPATALTPPDDEAEAAAEPPTEIAPAPQKTAELAEQKALKIEIDSGSDAVTGSLPSTGTSSSTLWPDASKIFMWTLALLFALTATLFFGRRRMLALPFPLSVPRLRGPAGLPALSRMLVSTGESDVAHRQEDDESASRLRLWDEDWLPRTMLEALDVLGVEPNADTDKIKSTVTRLRRALHPDHAFDEEDRALRERRLKQINVAWEIVSKKRRRAPWLKAKSRAS